MICSRELREAGKKYAKICPQHGSNGCPVPLTEDQKMEAENKYLRGQIKRYLKKWFGKKCPDYEKDCICCKKYRLMEKLLK